MNTVKIIFAVFISFAVSACGASNSYSRGTAASGEITWSYSGGLVAQKDGREISVQGSWSGLEEEVRCVERAREYADSTHPQTIAGNVMLWTGLAGVIGGPTVGLVHFAQDTDKNLVSGTIIMGSGLVGGLILAITGGYLQSDALVDAVDAVNVYNDHFQDTPACRAAAGLSARGDQDTPKK